MTSDSPPAFCVHCTNRLCSDCSAINLFEYFSRLQREGPPIPLPLSSWIHSMGEEDNTSLFVTRPNTVLRARLCSEVMIPTSRQVGNVMRYMSFTQIHKTVTETFSGASNSFDLAISSRTSCPCEGRTHAFRIDLPVCSTGYLM